MKLAAIAVVRWRTSEVSPHHLIAKMNGFARTATETELEECERAWLLALTQQNATALSELLHQEFSSTSARSAGKALRKREYISAALIFRICDYEIRQFEAFHLGNITVVKMRLFCRSKFREHDVHDDLVITDVWLWEDDAWRALTRHVSRIPE